MPSLHDLLPDVDAAGAARVLRDHWGLRGELRALPGERDRNFHVRASGGREFVLKFANAADDRALLELQQAVLAHLAAHLAALPGAPPVPRVIPSGEGEGIVAYDAGGAPLLARLLTWLPGEPLASWRPHTPGLLRDCGAALGAVARGLEGFHHPAARRDLKWDLAAAGWIGAHLDRIAEPARRAILARILARFERDVRPALGALRRAVVHNDANDHNILVVTGEDDAPRVGGVIDFGDVVESHPVCDLAIAAAYAMLDKPDPLSAAVPVVAGYHASHPLQEAELALLFPLVRTRLAVSVTNAALQSALAPDHTYLQVSASGAWRLLEQLEAVHERFAEYRFRAACALEPCPAGAAVARWIAEPARRFASVVEPSLRAPEVLVHDLSVSSGEIGTLDVWGDQARFREHVAGLLREAGASTGIGRYDEVRALYTTDLFRVAGNEGPEWRTVHLGVDVGQPAGSRVFAPLAGTVVSVRYNAGAGDYGPTIILEHEPGEGVPAFWTLYGHLSRASLAALAPGDRVAAGDPLGTLGDVHENGGWWPHLHVQVVCDRLGFEGDFPGVARPTEREVWLSLSPDPSPLLGLDARARAPRAPSADALRARRAQRLGPSLSVSYRRPLHIVRGVMQHLVDADGRRYLDAVNNVAHVGHGHPDVVRAGPRQMAVLNTNTRYLHEAVLEYAERLTATLPEPLRVCYFVNSGSEANELALRLAAAHTGEEDVIVVEAGYHGNTTTLVDVSPYKFDGPGGRGAPPWVHVTPMPDTCRGPFRGDDPTAGLKYAQGVRDAVGRIRQEGRRPSAFLCESILSCAGQVVLPPGYLAEAYRHVRAAGGVCIADEVQVGLGRVGTHWWAFETQGVVPDIVTMGKPIGNGHPLGAVVTTPEVAASFANGMEFFSTFGGNPVSCVVGLEVLRIVEREGLREHAQRTGAYLMEGLRGLMGRHALVGDVRGLGLFVGVELLADPVQRVPATRQAGYVANRMRELGVLVSTDGPDHNVLKLKPPLPFNAADADLLVATLDRVLAESPARDVVSPPR